MLVLVDLDGTLLPLSEWDPVFQEVSEVIASKVGVDWAVIYRAAKELNKELMRKFRPEAFDWDYVFTEVARRFGWASANIDVNEYLMKHIRDFRLYDGAIEFLRLVKDLGYGVAIATNGYYKYQSVVINELGLSKFVDEIRTPDRVGCPKNCCEFFRGGLVMVGDNPLFDVYYPSMCGLITVFVGNWSDRLNYVRNVWGLDLSMIRPNYSFSSIKEVSLVVKDILSGGLRATS